MRQELLAVLDCGLALLDVEESFAGFLGKTGEDGIGVVGMTTGLIPKNGAAELRVGELGDFGASGEADAFRGDFKADPFSGGGKVSDPVVVSLLAALAEWNEIFAPPGAVFPVLTMELQHELLGRVFGIEPDPGVEGVAFGQSNGLLVGVDDVLDRLAACLNSGEGAGMDIVGDGFGSSKREFGVLENDDVLWFTGTDFSKEVIAPFVEGREKLGAVFLGRRFKRAFFLLNFEERCFLLWRRDV